MTVTPTTVPDPAAGSGTGRRIAAYFARKLGLALLTVVIAALVVFLAIRAIPGDPAVVLAGDNQDPQLIAQIRVQLGLDKPIWVQFALFLGNALHGNLGTSTGDSLPVTTVIAQTLPVTLQLTVLSVIVAGILGIAAGVAAAYWRGRWPDWLTNIAALLGLSVPNFWFAILAILFLAGSLHLFPSSGYTPLSQDPVGWFQHMIVPALILGTSFGAIILRQTRASMLAALSSDYVLAARSRGTSEPRVVIRHSLRNSLTVVTTLIGLHLGALLSGAAVIEQIFGLPGMGRQVVTAVFARDYPVVQGVVLVLTVAYVVVNFVVDALYTVLDPRIRTERSA